ncbi:MAG: sugar transferase [Anaerolineales bacterium]
MSVPISVIVPVRNGAGTIASCLRALADQTLPAAEYEVIVVDDGSMDSTADVVRRQAVTLLSQPARGPAAARNVGVRRASGDTVVFTDADCVPALDFLEKLSAPLKDPSVSGVRGAYRTHQPGLVPRFVQAEYEHKYERIRHLDSIDFVDTYAAAYRRQVFLEAGGFDERFPSASVEDQELSFRLTELGHRLVFAPGAIVQHQHDSNPAAYFQRKFRIGYWKAVLLRWHPDRLGGDNHTPPAQRFQVASIPLAILFSALAFLWRPLGWPALAAWIASLLSSFKEMRSIGDRDPALLAIAPAMLVLRAVALSSGLALGLLTHPHEQPSVPGLTLTLTQRSLKRALDLVLASIGILLTAPLVALAALAIKLEDGGPVLYRQERVGEGGRRFTLWKLRSMVPDAEARLDGLLSGNVDKGPTFKIKDDPRVTAVGRITRRWSVDELPQLWNVLRGDMSMVGPRPEEVRVVAQYTPEQRRRLSVPPGLTGPMQVSGRGRLDLDHRLSLEIAYIEAYSVLLDLEILVRTVGAVIRGEGAF